jgi:hypothetical protein
MEKLIEDFFEQAPEESGPIYNERSLQLELACWFRRMGARVEFEHPYQVIGLPGSTCPSKMNLDLLVCDDDLRTAIELKVPLNGQHPETFYNFCNDISFIEGIVRGKFADKGCCLLITNDRNFWEDTGRGSTIHNLFRCKGSKLTGLIEKPTGQNKTRVALSGCYTPADNWRDVRDQRLMADAKYLLLDIAQIGSPSE